MELSGYYIPNQKAALLREQLLLEFQIQTSPSLLSSAKGAGLFVFSTGEALPQACHHFIHSYSDGAEPCAWVVPLEKHQEAAVILLPLPADPAYGASLQKILNANEECLQAAWDKFSSTPQQMPFQGKGFLFPTGKPYVMGVFNLTPDSFYDGGKYISPKDASERVRQLVEEGVDIIDLGGESTRPGSLPVDAEEQLRRILPTLEAITSHYDIPVSIDTTLPEVARACLEKGAKIINDVSGLQESSEILKVVHQYQAGYVLMHAQGKPREMQKTPEYTSLLLDVYQFFEEKLQLCRQAGISRESILLDPGIGFGKMINHNLGLLRNMAIFQNLGCQILLGTSNKSFIGEILQKEKEERLYGSIATQVLGYQSGAEFFRVHEVGPTKDALQVTACYQQPFRVS